MHVKNFFACKIFSSLLEIQSGIKEPDPVRIGSGVALGSGILKRVKPMKFALKSSRNYLSMSKAALLTLGTSTHLPFVTYFGF